MGGRLQKLRKGEGRIKGLKGLNDGVYAGFCVLLEGCIHVPSPKAENSPQAFYSGVFGAQKALKI